MKINFEHLDEPINLDKARSNVLVVENSSVYAKIIYSLYSEEDSYLKIYDENFKEISRKKIIAIFNPLEFNFDERNIKTVIYNHIINNMNLEQEVLQKIENHYQQIGKEIMGYLDNNIDIEFSCKEAVDMKEIFKLIGLSVSNGDVNSVFGKVQALLGILNEFFEDCLIVFINMSTLLLEKEYMCVAEQINLNSQTVLLLESNKNNFPEIPYYCLDNDFYLSRM